MVDTSPLPPSKPVILTVDDDPEVLAEQARTDEAAISDLSEPQSLTIASMSGIVPVENFIFPAIAIE